MNNCVAKTHIAPELPDAMKKILPELVDNLAHESRLLSLSARFRPEGDFPHAPHCYSRNILLHADNGAEVMIARWDQGAITPIHGHPQFAFVYVLQGQLQMEHYRNTEQGLVLAETIIKHEGQHIYAAGIAGRYDNAIHRVTALTPSLSLHVYSEDALKGKFFT
ncbi:cysteine dioxygenase [Thiolapillus sp.]